MIDKDLELFRLREKLKSKGLSESAIENIVRQADFEIQQKMQDAMNSAMERAIEAGIDKESSQFINELRPAPGAFLLETESGNTAFKEPPFPMLPHLLKNPRVAKDGSLYKVIPVGKSSDSKPKVSNNIFDAQKNINAQRIEEAKDRKRPQKSGQQEFRTATSKQSAIRDWVIPEKTADFTEELKNINNDLQYQLEEIVSGVIQDYEDDFV